MDIRHIAFAIGNADARNTSYKVFCSRKMVVPFADQHAVLLGHEQVAFSPQHTSFDQDRAQVGRPSQFETPQCSLADPSNWLWPIVHRCDQIPNPQVVDPHVTPQRADGSARGKANNASVFGRKTGRIRRRASESERPGTKAVVVGIINSVSVSVERI